MGTRAAQDAAVGDGPAVLQGESGVRTRVVVGAQLVQGRIDVRVPRLFVQGLAVEVLRHHALSEVGGLLNFEDQSIRTERVDHTTRDVDRIARPNGVARHYSVVVL